MRSTYAVPKIRQTPSPGLRRRANCGKRPAATISGCIYAGYPRLILRYCNPGIYSLPPPALCGSAVIHCHPLKQACPDHWVFRMEPIRLSGCPGCRGWSRRIRGMPTPRSPCATIAVLVGSTARNCRQSTCPLSLPRSEKFFVHVSPALHFGGVRMYVVTCGEADLAFSTLRGMWRVTV